MQRQNVTFASDDQQCAGWFYTPDQPPGRYCWCEAPPT
jgi:hypothetical protein